MINDGCRRAPGQAKGRPQRPVMANIDRVRNRVRLGISAFVLILLITVVLGLVWTSHHQSPPLRTASHLVLLVAGAAGLFGLVKIWRTDVAPPGQRGA
jgi:hypothetical protein